MRRSRRHEPLRAAIQPVTGCDGIGMHSPGRSPVVTQEIGLDEQNLMALHWVPSIRFGRCWPGPPMPVELPSESGRQRLFKIRAAETSRERRSASDPVEQDVCDARLSKHAPGDEEDDTREDVPRQRSQRCDRHLTIGLDSSVGLKVDELFPGRGRSLSRCRPEDLRVHQAGDGPARTLAAFAGVDVSCGVHLRTSRQGLDPSADRSEPAPCSLLRNDAGLRSHCGRTGTTTASTRRPCCCRSTLPCGGQVRLFGGRPEMCAVERSAYPHFFSSKDEAGIVGRLRRTTKTSRMCSRSAPSASAHRCRYALH